MADRVTTSHVQQLFHKIFGWKKLKTSKSWNEEGFTTDCNSTYGGCRIVYRENDTGEIDVTSRATPREFEQQLRVIQKMSSPESICDSVGKKYSKKRQKCYTPKKSRKFD